MAKSSSYMRRFSTSPRFLSNLVVGGVSPKFVHDPTANSLRHRLFSSSPSYKVNDKAKDVPKGLHLTQRNSVLVKRRTISVLENILQHKFKNRELLVEAMTHRSIINSASHENSARYESEDGTLLNVKRNNERLELVGDRVLGLVVVESLYSQNRFESEGDMSGLSQTLVSRKKANDYCKLLGLDKFLLQSRALRGHQGSRYGDFFEALLGALFLDGGYPVARRFFEARVVPIWEFGDLDTSQDSCGKRALQEYLVNCGLSATALGTHLKYVEVKAELHGGKQRFTQAVELFGRKVSAAKGPTRVSADQLAARRLLGSLKRAKTTCFLIRMAKQKNDRVSLAKLQAARALQVQADATEIACETASEN